MLPAPLQEVPEAQGAAIHPLQLPVLWLVWFGGLLVCFSGFFCFTSFVLFFEPDCYYVAKAILELTMAFNSEIRSLLPLQCWDSRCVPHPYGLDKCPPKALWLKGVVPAHSTIWKP